MAPRSRSPSAIDFVGGAVFRHRWGVPTPARRPSPATTPQERKIAACIAAPGVSATSTSIPEPNWKGSSRVLGFPHSLKRSAAQRAAARCAGNPQRRGPIASGERVKEPRRLGTLHSFSLDCAHNGARDPDCRADDVGWHDVPKMATVATATMRIEHHGVALVHAVHYT